MRRRYKALILNDYEEAHYAQLVKDGKKLIETRMGKQFSYRGDLIICCGASNSVTDNAGKALCIVDLWKARPMKNESREIEAACIGWHEKRKSHLLRNWRHFNYDFTFKDHVVIGEGKSGANYQGIFEIDLPDDVIIIPRGDIIPYNEEPDLQTSLF